MDNPPPPRAPEWMAQPAPPAVPPPPSRRPSGWFVDPWAPDQWRWWDGGTWTGHVAVRDKTQKNQGPRLPSFLSPPVVVAAIPSIPLIAFILFIVPLAIALGLVPLLLVAPVLWWMDRVEPEPWSERVHAFLWGAFVAGLVSLVFNTVFATLTGSETLAAVISAPFIEELTKAGAIIWAVRRKHVDGIMDGLTYAGWSALGFAVIEDFSYFWLAEDEDLLFETFVGRALFTPFAHPLFSAWTGLAIGLAVRRRRPLITAWWGLALAMASHAAWNGALSLAESEGGAIVTIVVLVGFVVLFICTAIGVMVLRRRDRVRLTELAPLIAHRYGLPLDRVLTLSNPRDRRKTRRSLPKSERKALDAEAGAIARLGALFDHKSAPDPADEARLVSQLVAARG